MEMYLVGRFSSVPVKSKYLEKKPVNTVAQMQATPCQTDWEAWWSQIHI